MAKDSRDGKMLGIGLDGHDGHLRLTRGGNFHLVGGSEQTHKEMQESCVKFNEKLDALGKRLVDLERTELRDLAAECDMNLLNAPPDRKSDKES